jgi:hypothetical protein
MVSWRKLGPPGPPPTSMSTKAPHSPVPVPLASEDDIRDYAYHLYDQSGFAAGRDLDNWLEAKACLSSGVPKSESHIRLHQNSFRKRP